MNYQPQDIEQKWQKYWAEHSVYKVENDSDKPKYYVLDMFPYPSGAGLHVGHPLGYIASDIFARYKRLSGFNVLHPMGYDAFGLPAEQYAIQTGVHPADSTAQNVQRYRQQLDKLGFCYDWSREVNTSDPNYYKWTQQIFLWLFEHYYDNDADKAMPISMLLAKFEAGGSAAVNATHGHEDHFSAEDWKNYSDKEKDEVLMNYRLAYRKVGYVNWCEQLGTVLANDEVKDGLSERGGYPVVQKPMLQWALRITAYAQRLLDGLETVDFSEALKTQQRNWIGRSEGAQVFFEVADHDGVQIEIFTTRPDTIFGATFMVLAPEHELVAQLTTAEQKEDIDAYIKYAGSRSERDRMTDVKSVTGAFTGAYATHPLNGKRIPIWISDYVLAGYGTGAVMAVPSDDERDNRFANHFGIEIIPVVDQSEYPDAEIGDKVGKMINSDFLNGMEVKKAIGAAIDKIEALGIGQKRINYRLRDANFSRQRYWGEPFPIKYDADGISHIDNKLPLELPPLNNFQPTADGHSPLARVEDWVNTEDGMTRETDTMPGFAGSSWYFLRYMDANNEEEAFSQHAVNYWQDVDLYLGGAEHAVGHLMYSRFWHKFLHDIGKVPTQEPYKKLINQGMIQGVIEEIYMLKDKPNGQLVFVSADRLEEFGGEDNFSKIAVHIDFVSNYGAPDSYLDADGIQQFKKWRKENAEAVFETNADGHLVTTSEIGKMSKRYFNVVNPDDIVNQHGADCLRLHEMFLGPLEDSKPWNTSGISGISRFLRKFWGLFYDNDGNYIVTEATPNAKELKALHTVIKSVKQGLDTFSLNTCVSDFMKLANELRDLGCHKKAILNEFLLLIAPFAPHIAEELWEKLGHQVSIFQNGAFPAHNEQYLVANSIEYPICVNGKKRALLELDANMSKEDMEAEALALEEIQKWIDGKQIRKVIVVPKRMINIVV
jgi:leucyl-tRNA synthetase